MLYVSIFVELLRSRPSLAVWLAALAQALLWLLVSPCFMRAGRPHHAAVGDHPAALLARRGRGPAGLLAAAGHRDRAAFAHDLCRVDPSRLARAVHGCKPPRACGAQVL